MRIRWRGFATTFEQQFPVATSHSARPHGAGLCTSDLCHRCSVLRFDWRWTR